MAEERQNTGAKKRRKPVIMTGTKIKIYGCVTMLFYSISLSVIRNGMLHSNQYTSSELAELLGNDTGKMIIATWASLFQLVGGLAIPVFAFLLVEGFTYTQSFRKYLLGMVIFAVVSEIPYDLAINQSLFDMSGQNYLFTLAICLVMMYGLRLFQDRKGMIYRLAQAMIILAGILWCSLCNVAFGLGSVLLVAIYYLLYEKKGVRILLGCLASLLYVTGPISAYVLWSYSGDRGWNKNKYVFYILYPLHLLILGGITWMMGGF